MLKNATKVIMLSLCLANAAFALDISKPIIRCDAGQTMVMVGKKAADDGQLYIGLYQWKKIQHPGYGQVNYPEPIINASPVTKTSPALIAITYLAEGKISLYAKSEFAPEDIDFEEPLRTIGRVNYLANGRKQTINNMKCQVFEEAN